MNATHANAMNTPAAAGLLARLFLRERSSTRDISSARSAKRHDGDKARAARKPARERVHMRSAWISDVHLGTRACKAEYLLDFLNHLDCGRLYLVGDVIDFWALKGSWYWPETHNRVLQKFMEMAANGVEVIFVPGNHDELLRDYAGAVFAGVKVEMKSIHRTADGRRLLVIHGDEFDTIVKHSKWLALFGSWIYDVLLYANRWVNFFRRKFGRPYWSLAAYLKHKVKNAVNFISNFEHALAHEARRHQVDGVVCGHIHKAEITDVNGVRYCNDGDWVESCTAMVERQDGSLAILSWTDKTEWLIEEPAAATTMSEAAMSEAA
jgi:UDP-2,3-diacylglucosamine pyrophosphatase LpxH